MTKSEAVVIESIEVRELLRFLFYLDILNKLSLLQRKHSKYMYAKCLNFSCFITYLAACMHAFCMFYLYVSLGMKAFSRKKIISSANYNKFSKFKSFLIFTKKLSIQVEKGNFQEIISFDGHSTAHFSPLPILKKKSSFFFKKNQI